MLLLSGASAARLAEACFLHVAPLIKTQITSTTNQVQREEEERAGEQSHWEFRLRIERSSESFLAV